MEVVTEASAADELAMTVAPSPSKEGEVGTDSSA